MVLPSWIGAFRIGENNDNSNWSWVTDQAMTYDNWSGGGPSNSNGNEDCAAIYGNENGQWNDLDCKAPYVTDFICQK